MTHRKLNSTTPLLAFIAALSLVSAGCGGADGDPTGGDDDNTGEQKSDGGDEDNSPKEELSPTGPVPRDAIRLTITDSNATLFPNGVYYSPWSANASSSTQLQITSFGFMPGGAHELAFSDSILVAHSGARIRTDESTNGRETPVGHISIWAGSPPTAHQGLSNDDPIELFYSYDAETDAFTGSFEGTFTESDSNGARTAHVKADFHINNFIE